MRTILYMEVMLAGPVEEPAMDISSTARLGQLMPYRDKLRTNHSTLEIGEALRASPEVLLGVGPGATAALADLGIETVFDLAASETFSAADRVLRAATDPGSAESKTGALPADLVATPPGTTLVDVPTLDAAALRGLGGEVGSRAKESLEVWTIRDVALWPPYLAAEAILDEATGAKSVGVDETPNDLLPGSGRYPTERAYYGVYVLADIDDPVEGERRDLKEAGPLDIANATGSGFTRPVRGARVTMAQSWYSEGVALGQLLHSLALAPGESTRVAMIDWTRQQMGTQQERDAQTEQLVGDLTHKRAMSEVQDAVAREAQNGFSSTDTTSQQMQVGAAGGIGAGALTLGGSFSTAKSTGSTATVTGTSGVRSISAKMSQNVSDTTHQAASSARNRFASVVRELSQSEHEKISTRVVANYNHMHALTVQYYEVVQIYRAVTQLHRFEPCLFIPMKPIDFLPVAGFVGGSGESIVRRYRAALQAAALDDDTRKMLDLNAFGLVRTTGRGDPTAPVQALPKADEDLFRAGIDEIRRRTGREVVSIEGAAVELPEEALLRGVQAAFPFNAMKVGFRTGGGAKVIDNPSHAGNVTIDPPVPLSELGYLQLDTGGPFAKGVVTLLVEYDGFLMHIPFSVTIPESTPDFQEVAISFIRHEVRRSLLKRLSDDQLYYSQAVWRAMDSATAAQLLAPYSYEGKPLAKVVDPAPIDTTGNFLIFRMPWEARDLINSDAFSAPVADGDWAAWIQRQANYDETRSDLIPLPSGGVFAESVLGRSNGAEKLDISRFWNWQDSPIPLQAPDITAIQAGSRARDDNTTPAGFASPIVAFNNPPPLPDPAGLGATLAALANGGMFRDQSGSAITQAVALAALQNSAQGATDAGAQASTNLAAAAAKEVELAKIAAGLVAPELAAAGGAGSGTVSEQGARINAGRSMDERGVPGADGAKGTNGQAGSHEAQAAEGSTGRVLNILDSAIKEPPSTSGSSSNPKSQPAPKPDATAQPDGGAQSETPATPKPSPAPKPAPPPKPGSQSKPAPSGSSSKPGGKKP